MHRADSAPQLADKVKVGLAADALAGQLSRHVPGVDIDDDQGAQDLALKVGQLAPHLVHHLLQHTTHGEFLHLPIASM